MASSFPEPERLMLKLPLLCSSKNQVRPVTGAAVLDKWIRVLPLLMYVASDRGMLIPLASVTNSSAVPSERAMCSAARGESAPIPTLPFGMIRKLSLCALAGVVSANDSNAAAAKIMTRGRCCVVVIRCLSWLLVKLALDAS